MAVEFRAYKLAEREANFKKSLVDSYGKKWTASDGEFPGVVRLKTKDSSNFWYPQIIKKQKVVIHGTAGMGPASDIGELSKPNNHVSVAYVVARDGTIYQIFPDDGWAYHLGSTSSAPNSIWSQKTVAIEVCNILGLKESQEDHEILLDTYNKPYCKKSDTQFYQVCDYRGFKYFASFTDAQYTSVNSLVVNICKKFAIPFSKLPIGHEYEWYSKVPDSSIFTHTNVRKDKIDMSPAFDFSRITGV